MPTHRLSQCGWAPGFSAIDADLDTRHRPRARPRLPLNDVLPAVVSASPEAGAVTRARTCIVVTGWREPSGQR